MATLILSFLYEKNTIFYNSLFLDLNTNPASRLSQSNSIASELGSPIDPNMTAEELQAARAEWQGELTQVEDEIATLRQVSE